MTDFETMRATIKTAFDAEPDDDREDRIAALAKDITDLLESSLNDVKHYQKGEARARRSVVDASRALSDCRAELSELQDSHRSVLADKLKAESALCKALTEIENQE